MLVATGAVSGMPHINERVAAANGLVVEDAVQNVQCKRSRTSSLGRYRPADVGYDVRMGLLSLQPPRALMGLSTNFNTDMKKITSHMGVTSYLTTYAAKTLKASVPAGTAAGGESASKAVTNAAKRAKHD